MQPCLNNLHYDVKKISYSLLQLVWKQIPTSLVLRPNILGTPNKVIHTSTRGIRHESGIIGGFVLGQSTGACSVSSILGWKSIDDADVFCAAHSTIIILTFCFRWFWPRGIFGQWCVVLDISALCASRYAKPCALLTEFDQFARLKLVLKSVLNNRLQSEAYNYIFYAVNQMKLFWRSSSNTLYVYIPFQLTDLLYNV